ncbi:hypothetical protein ELQ90_09505 [Labedella phragmitis]|uniref:DUF7882 domain-containing protein n=1 Tax=Labedella phragmitis TaxID=2498849 RepID=A0A444PT24_9MICO|nr:hypothetical protein [Labedella phragmitis]RWZ51024.1 hypothetical protein ELQ90_09505 [Labedella phragmitis]
MAVLIYGSETFEFDERLLAHVKIVITQKLRRSESFLLSWTHRDGRGRSSVWVNASSDLHFRFAEAKPPVLNQQWLSMMMESSYASRGLDVDAVAEPTAAE